MARKSRTAVLKRQREAKKAERAAAKREKKEIRHTESTTEPRVASQDDLAGYGFDSEEEAVEEEG